MQKKEDLLVTTTTCPVSTNDRQPRFVLDLAASLLPHYQRVHLLAPGAPGAAPMEEINGVIIHRFPYARPASLQKLCYRHGIMQNIRANPALLALLPSLIWSQIAAIRRICRDYPVKTINAHWFVFQGLTAAIACRGQNIRLVPHSHGADVHLLEKLGRLGSALAGFVVRNSDNIICESTYVRDKLDNLLDFPSKAEVSCMGAYVHNFANNAGKTPTDTRERPSILFVGRLVEKKGVEYLIRAMPLIIATIPDARLLIAGGGALESQLQNLAANMGLTPSHVEFLGPLSHNQIASQLAKVKAVALPSIVDSHGEADGMPTVLIEAMAARRPIVASRVNGIPDLLKHEENGWLCEPKNIEDLASKLKLAMTYSGNAILDSAYKTALLYDWPVLGARYASLLEK